MKKLIFSLAVIMASVGWINAANGSDGPSVVVSPMTVPSNFVGSYTGLLHNIIMNGNDDYEDREMTFKVISADKLQGTLPQIGSMPGTITIDLPISVATNGNMTTTAGSGQVGTLKLNIFPYLTIPLYLDGTNATAFTGASIDPVTKEMNFTLKVKGEYLGISMYPAQVSFTSSIFTP
ncbi:hypothetical protein [Proteiniphilum sp. UBA5384]|uniref:hypothetical protein n=1 Tax=Proteiniphilum sp. UBA5384 TaxID=1947279 RepID=UPI0025DBFE30|nr:hypothetical protein [Proteiniphilum sp. UBA5384]